jgi:cardiolipin synthase C
MDLSPLRLAMALVYLTSSWSLLADGVRLLGTDLEAMEARVETVLETESELLASAFVFGDDPLTLTSLSLLRDASRRGVGVRLITDALWNRIPPAVMAHLIAEGIEVREFHPWRIDHPTWIFRRLHDKLLISDGEVLLAGGRNVQSTYFGFGHQIEARNYIDLDLLVSGVAAAEARQYFLALWESESVSTTGARATSVEIEAAARELDRHKVWLDERVERARNDAARIPAPLHEVGTVQFLHDPVPGGVATRKVAAGLRDLLDAARESVIIESPYLVTTRAMRTALRDALARGVRIRILTNSLASTDNLWAQAGYVSEKPFLVRSGIELWEYEGPECLHTKAAVIDGKVVIVGSYNLDPRSQNLNREVALVVDDEVIAADLRVRMDAHLTNAVRIDGRGYPLGSDELYPGVERSKIFKLGLLQIIAPLIRRQL